MLHSLIEFWTNTYWRYQEPLTGGIRFHVPGFSDPLISPVFVTEELPRFLTENGAHVSHFNLVGTSRDAVGAATAAGYECHRRLALGVRELRDIKRDPSVSFDVQPLTSALKGDRLLPLLSESFGNDFGFYQKLLPFLATTDARCTCVFLRSGEADVGAISMAVSGSTCLLLAAVIRPASRGQGFCAKLVDVAAAVAFAQGAEEAVFWTEDESLLKHADRSLEYLVFTRKTEGPDCSP